MAHESQINADWRIDVFILSIFKQWLFHWAEQSLGLGHALVFWLLFGHLLLLLCDNSFVLAYCSIISLNKALGNLEEILVRFIGSKLHIEIHRRIGLNLCCFRLYSEGVLHPLPRGFIQDIQEGPADCYGEWIFILHS